MTRFRRFLVLAVLVASLVWAQRAMTVAQLEQFVKSSIDQKQKDNEVAGILKNVKMTQKLEMRVVENLQGAGAGPKTLEALKALATASATLAVPGAVSVAPKAPPRPAPSAAEIKKVLAD